MTLTSAFYFCCVHRFQKGLTCGLQVLEMAEDREAVLLGVIVCVCWGSWRCLGRLEGDLAEFSGYRQAVTPERCVAFRPLFEN